MSDIIKVTASYDKGNLNSGLADARNQLAQTAVAAAKLDSTLKTSVKGSNQAAAALTNVGRVAQDLPFGFIGIQNNLNPLLESFTRLKQETGSGAAALKSLASSLIGAGGIGLALSVVSSALVIFQNGIMGFNKKTKEAKEAADELSKAYSQITSSIAQEVAKVDVLVATLKNENLSRAQRNEAIKELQRIAPAYFNNLSTEKFSIDALTASYNKFNESIVKSITARVREKELENVIKRIVELEDKKNTAQQEEIVIGGKIVKVNNARIQSVEEYNEGIKNSSFLTNKENDELLNLYKTRQRLSQLVAQGTGAENLVVPVKEVKVKPEKIKIEKPALDTPFLLPQQKATVEIDVAPKLLAKGFDITEINKAIERAKVETARKLAEFKDMFGNISQDIFTAFADGIGNAISGGKLTGIFDGLMKAVGSGLRQLGIYFLASSKLIKAIKEKLVAVPQLSAVAALGLIALGTAIIAASNKKAAFATGVRGFDGGTALVGERGPELVQLPRGSNVIPAAQTAGMMGNQEIFITGEFRQRGSDLVMVMNRASAKISRNF
jgi:hypothetical protein